MTIPEAIARLKELRVHAESDREVAHEQADEVLLELIGDEGVSTAFCEIEKWYA